MRAGAFTLVELLAVLAIVATLAAVLLPVVGAALENGRRTDCRGNVGQLAARLLIAAADRDGLLPPQFAHAGGVQGEWGNEQGGTGSGSDWAPTLLFDAGTGPEDVRILRCRSDRQFYPQGGVSLASYKHWLNRPQTATRRLVSDPARSVIVSEHASNHGTHYSLLDEEGVNYACLDGAVATVAPSDVDFSDVHRWGTLANGIHDGPGPLP